ncbi:hypothetical protein GW17_00039570 [Ensete ventricosum]|nr:hypothetical protein GW17_00039570 [Ensete ventricosum]
MGRRFNGPHEAPVRIADRGTWTAESATAHVALHQAWRPKRPRRSEMDDDAGPLRGRSTDEALREKSSSMEGPRGPLAHSASAAAKGSGATAAVAGEAMARFLREPAGVGRKGGGRGRRRRKGADERAGVLGMPGRCSHENGTAEEEGRNGEGWPPGIVIGMLRRRSDRPKGGDPASRSMWAAGGDHIAANAEKVKRRE